MAITLNASTSNGLQMTSDTSGDVAIQSNGSTKLTITSTGVYGGITSATAQASTSGTSIDFTGIPSWAKRITIMFNGVSTNGISYPQIQIGSGSVETSGYTGTSWNNSSGIIALSGTGISLPSANAAATLTGHFILTLLGSNLWVVSGLFLSSGSSAMFSVSATKTTSGTLDRLRITTAGGTDAFDAGSINIMYEG